MEDLGDRNVDLQNKLEEFQDQMSKRIDEVRRRAQESAHTGEGYKSDEFRLMGDGLNRLASTLERKNFGKEMRKAVETLAQPQPQPTAEEPPEERVETDESRSNVPELLRESGAENLVEEG